MKTLQKPKLPHSSGLVLTTIVLMTVALVQIFPFYWMLTFSLKSNADIYAQRPFSSVDHGQRKWLI